MQHRLKNMPFFLTVLIFFLSALCSLPADSYAGGGIDPADPMVRVTSPKTDIDVEAVLIKISKDVSERTGIKESFITYYWQTFDAVVYDGKKSTKPLFVDLYVPGFFDDDKVKEMMTAIADALVEHTGAERKWIFIHTHFPLPGQVYIGGGVAEWDSYRGKAVEK